MCATRATTIAIGATTRQHVVESDPIVRAKLPLLAKVMPFVGHTRDAGARHGRRLARQRRSGGGDRAGRGDARRDVGLARGRHEQSHRGGRFLPRPDGDGAAADRLPRPRRASRCGRRRGSAWASTRSTRGRAISPSCRPRRRSRSTRDGRCTRAAIGIGAATAVPLRLDAVAEALKGQRFDEGNGARGGQSGARRHRSRWPICTPRPIIAGASP